MPVKIYSIRRRMVGEKMKHTEQMALARIGVHVEHRTGEVTKAQDIVALSRINRNLAVLEDVAIHKRNETRVSAERHKFGQKLQLALSQVQILHARMNASCNSKKCRYT
jgi:thioredoxin reductase